MKYGVVQCLKKLAKVVKVGVDQGKFELYFPHDIDKMHPIFEKSVKFLFQNMWPNKEHCKVNITRMSLFWDEQ